MENITTCNWCGDQYIARLWEGEHKCEENIGVGIALFIDPINESESEL